MVLIHVPHVPWLPASAWQAVGRGLTQRALLDDGVTATEAVASALAGELIEDYPEARICPACLVLGPLPDGSPLMWCGHSMPKAMGAALLRRTVFAGLAII